MAQLTIDDRTSLQGQVQALLALMDHKDSGNQLPAFPLSAGDLQGLCTLARGAFLKEPCLLELSGGIVVVGDIHGQYEDLLKIFQRQGFPPHTRYLFLGDFVDRGHDGLEVMALLMAYKLLYPEHVYLLRGNHESSFITLMYGFYAECLRKLSEDAWTHVCGVFDCLPAAARIGGRILCLHGGISPHLHELSEINAIQRPASLDHEQGGLLTDLVWSDPSGAQAGWVKNSRGAGWLFGSQALKAFNRRNNIQMIIRAHETVLTGWESFGNGALYTVFSAPDYQGYSNTGATMTVRDDLSYSFEMYLPVQAGTAGAAQHCDHACSAAQLASASDASSFSNAAVPPCSPFAAAQQQDADEHDAVTQCSMPRSCSMQACDYHIPVSPFACAAATSPAASPTADWQGTCALDTLFGSLKATLPGSLTSACSYDLGEHSSILSQRSTAVSVTVRGV